MARKRKKPPKLFRSRSVSDEEKLAEARRMHDNAETVLYRAVSNLARARELVRAYEAKLGIGLEARSAAGLVSLARAAVKTEARSWLAGFGFDVPEHGGEPTSKAGPPEPAEHCEECDQNSGVHLAGCPALRKR